MTLAIAWTRTGKTGKDELERMGLIDFYEQNVKGRFSLPHFQVFFLIIELYMYFYFFN